MGFPSTIHSASALSGAPCRRDPDRVETGADEVAAESRCLAEQELVVGGEALRPVVELADPGLRESRDAAYGLVHQHREVLPVLVEELELERVGDLVRRHPRLRLGFETAHHEPTDLLLEVGVAVGVAQDRQVRVQAVELVGDDVEVLGGVQRHGHADLVAERLGPLARAVDDDLGLDVAPVGAHAAHSAARRLLVGQEPGDADSLDDPRAATPGTLGERHREVGRVDLPVARQPDRAEQVVDLHHRPMLERLVRAEHPAFEVVRRGGCRRTAELGHPVLGARHDQATALLVARGQTGLGLETGVELGGVLDQPGAALGGPQQADQTGRVPRRPAGERALLQEQHVAPAELGEVVGHAGADHPTPHDHDAGAGGQVSHRAVPRSSGGRRPGW